MREAAIYPVSVGYVYKIMFGKGLYGDNAAKPEYYSVAKTAAEVCNTAYEVGRNNGRANVNRLREYLKELKKLMKETDSEKKCKELYKAFLGIAEMAYRDGFCKGQQEREEK